MDRNVDEQIFNSNPPTLTSSNDPTRTNLNHSNGADLNLATRTVPPNLAALNHPNASESNPRNPTDSNLTPHIECHETSQEIDNYEDMKNGGGSSGVYRGTVSLGEVSGVSDSGISCNGSGGGGGLVNNGKGPGGDGGVIGRDVVNGGNSGAEVNGDNNSGDNGIATPSSNVGSVDELGDTGVDITSQKPPPPQQNTTETLPAISATLPMDVMRLPSRETLQTNPSYESLDHFTKNPANVSLNP